MMTSSGMVISRKRETEEVTEAVVMTVKEKRNDPACLLLPAMMSHEPSSMGDAARA